MKRRNLEHMNLVQRQEDFKTYKHQYYSQGKSIPNHIKEEHADQYGQDWDMKKLG